MSGGACFQALPGLFASAVVYHELSSVSPPCGGRTKVIARDVLELKASLRAVRPATDYDQRGHEADDFEIVGKWFFA